MDRDKLKKEIVDYLAWVDGMNLLTLDYDDRAEGILSLLAPVIKNSEMWDKLVALANRYGQSHLCDKDCEIYPCPEGVTCDYAYDIIIALTNKEADDAE